MDNYSDGGDKVEISRREANAFSEVEVFESNIWEDEELWVEPKFGEKTVSWQTVWDHLYPEYDEFDLYAPHDDGAASDMHRLRGLVATQCAETEAVLGKIALHFDKSLNVERRTAGQLLHEVRRLLGEAKEKWATELTAIDGAIRRRNHVIHSPATIASDRIGDGDWVPVLSFIGDDIYDEGNLRRDLALQHEAIIAAVRLFHSLSADSKEDVASGPEE
ncbi:MULTISPECIES: hypothetical protein [Protofrankia]|uniref:hypothetical protein n=1 Tax=Protofrankia TaxID=2994361 RepID=UPI001115744F|nr:MULTISPECIES: hypothetical protein [Protofrankia]